MELAARGPGVCRLAAQLLVYVCSHRSHYCSSGGSIKSYKIYVQIARAGGTPQMRLLVGRDSALDFVSTAPFTTRPFTSMPSVSPDLVTPVGQVQVDRITYNSISQALPDVDISPRGRRMSLHQLGECQLGFSECTPFS